MATTIREIRTLNKGDYIEASELYYRFIKINIKNKTITLTPPFPYGQKPIGRIWTSKYDDSISKIDYHYWNIIRKNSPKAKGIEKKVK